MSNVHRKIVTMAQLMYGHFPHPENDEEQMKNLLLSGAAATDVIRVRDRADVPEIHHCPRIVPQPLGTCSETMHGMKNTCIFIPQEQYDRMSPEQMAELTKGRDVEIMPVSEEQLDELQREGRLTVITSTDPPEPDPYTLHNYYSDIAVPRLLPSPYTGKQRGPQTVKKASKVRKEKKAKRKMQKQSRRKH